jgi:hypothetical protein
MTIPLVLTISFLLKDYSAYAPYKVKIIPLILSKNHYAHTQNKLKHFPLILSTVIN